MFKVRWERSALDELTNLWLQAGSAMRAAITAATHDLDEHLQTDPLRDSESREGGVGRATSTGSISSVC